MNLTRVLDVALPEIPARTLGERYPRVPPDILFKQQEEDGKPIVRVLVRSQEATYSFPPSQWDLVQLFDGLRSYEQIAAAFSQQTGAEYSVQDIREFADSLEEMGFWYKTPQEKNVALMRKTAAERKKILSAKKNRWGDLSQIAFPAVNPDNFLTWIHGYTGWIYTWWFTLLTLVAFAVMTGITVTHWSEIGRDSLEFFNFTHKTWGDVAQFYLVAIGAMCWHELGHGHACKHYGGRVPSMGFLLIYLTPAFYTDTTDGQILGNRFQRFIISLAGAWSELYICFVATLVWWVTPPATALHDVAYFMLLITGIASVLINFNPLMKLDGYYMLCDTLDISELKENSTAYLSAWIKHHLWRLPVEVPYVPKRRRFGFVVYALLSGAYSYTILYIVARFVGNVFRNFNPDWSFVPELGTAALVFRSRIRTLVNFLKFVYLDKRDRVLAWLRGRQFAAVLALLVIFLLIPVWRESVQGSFVLESATSAIIRNPVAGIVISVQASEGQTLPAGALLVTLRNLPLQSRLERLQADYALASLRATSASLHYGNLGFALQQREKLAHQVAYLQAQAASLEVRTPISGLLLTPRLADRLGSYLPEGTPIAEIADLTTMRARIYVSEHDMAKLHLGSPARLRVEGLLTKWDTSAVSISPGSSPLSPALADPLQYKGLAPPKFYLVDLLVPNPDQTLKPGMVGTARIYGGRKSLALLGWLEIARFFGRKIW